jgi:hypothetical protein
VQLINLYMLSPVAFRQLLRLHPNSLAAPRHRRCRSQQGLSQLIRPVQHHIAVAEHPESVNALHTARTGSASFQQTAAEPGTQSL